MLEEIWRIKDELANEAGNNVHQLCEQTRQWAIEHPHDGPVVRNAEDLRRLIEQDRRERSQPAPLALKEAPPKYGSK
jgi:hypothetical protein